MSGHGPAGPPLAPGFAPYRDEFAAIEALIRRTPGFSLQPVELPSPDLARALAGWLGGRGFAVERLDLDTAEQWLGLARRLEGPFNGAPGAAAALTVVSAGHPLPADEELAAALARVNMARDVIARRRAHTILWCGGADVQRATRRAAPDLWSVADIPVVIRLRRIEDDYTRAIRELQTRAARTSSSPVSELQAQLAEAQRRRSRGEAHLRRDLAHHHLAAGDRAAAIAELLRARGLQRALGDAVQSLFLTVELALTFGDDLPPDVTADLEAEARALAPSTDVLSCAHAKVALARLALVGQRFVEADAWADEALSAALGPKGVGVRNLALVALEIRAEAAFLGGDLEGALALAERCLDAAEELGDPQAKLPVGLLRARIQGALDDSGAAATGTPPAGGRS